MGLDDATRTPWNSRPLCAARPGTRAKLEPWSWVTYSALSPGSTPPSAAGGPDSALVHHAVAPSVGCTTTSVMRLVVSSPWNATQVQPSSAETVSPLLSVA